jgi:hypothetical protein
MKNAFGNPRIRHFYFSGPIARFTLLTLLAGAQCPVLATPAAGSEKITHSTSSNGREELKPVPAAQIKKRILIGEAAGLLPDTGKDCTQAFQAALEILRQHPGTTLKLNAGAYHFWPLHAAKREHYQSNTDATVPKAYALLLEGQMNTVIDGGGATLLFHGPMSAIGVDGCANIKIRNLNITTPRLFTSQGKVVDADADWQALQIDQDRFPYVVEDGVFKTMLEGVKSKIWGRMEYDTADGRFSHGDQGGVSRAEELKPGLVKLWSSHDVAKAGNILVLRHHERTHAGVFILGSQNVTLENVEVWGTAGLGILCQQSRKLTFLHTHVRPQPDTGLVCGPKDDGYHFSGCSGQITLDACIVAGTADDPINVHGTSLPVVEQTGSATVTARFGHPQSIGQSLWARPGNRISVIDRETLLPSQENCVKSFRLVDPQTVEIEFAKSFLEPVTQAHALENLSDTPDVTIRGCAFSNGRARGILCSTPGKVLIENNTFIIHGAAILIPGDANGWYESGAVNDVTIRGNRFDNCLVADSQFSDGVIAIWPEIHRYVAGHPFHRNIRIENNIFRVFDRPILYASSVNGLSFTGNTVVRTETFTPWHRNSNAITLKNCLAVKIRGNRVQGELLDRKIQCESTPAAEIQIGVTEPFFLAAKQTPVVR